MKELIRQIEQIISQLETLLKLKPILINNLSIIDITINLRDLQTELQQISAVLHGWLSWFLGDFDGLIYALTIFIGINFITNIMRAIVEKNLFSVFELKCVFKKILIFCLIGMAHILDKQIITYGSFLRTVVVLFYLSNEGRLFINNATQLGLPIPKIIKEIIKHLYKR